MKQEYQVTGVGMFAFYFVILISLLGISIYNFVLGFVVYAKPGYYFCISVSIFSLFALSFYNGIVRAKRFIRFENKGLLIVYFLKKCNRHIDYKEIAGYFIRKDESKGKLVGYKVFLQTCDKKQFDIDIGTEEIEDFKESLSQFGVSQIPSKFPKMYLLFIPVILVYSISYLIVSQSKDQKKETVIEKNNLIELKVKLSKVERNYNVEKSSGGINLKFEEYKGLEFCIDYTNVLKNDLDPVFRVENDTTTYFFQISKKNYNLRITKTVKPNFFQKYFNDRIEIYGMRSYQKTYFEVFK